MVRTFSDSQENEVIEAGTYVCSVTCAKKPYSNNTKTGLNLCFKVDASIPGQEKYTNTRVFELLLEDASSTPTDWWVEDRKFQKLITATLEPTRYDKDTNKPIWEVTDIEQTIQDINGKLLKVTFTKEYDDYHQGDINKVQKYSYQKYFTDKNTTAPAPAPAPAKPAEPNSANLPPVNDDNLPF